MKRVSYQQRSWEVLLKRDAAFERSTKDYSDTDLSREWAKRWAEIETEREAAFQAIAFVGVLELVK